jgi:uncharacterized repeat protein (TIGR03943 family)
MKPQTRRIIHAIAVLVWSAVLLYFYSSGRINKYLTPDFRPLCFIGGLGLAVLGLFNLLTAGQDGDCCHGHAGDDEGGSHECGDMNPWTSFILMVLPVVLSVAWAKDEYSVSALSRKGLYDAPSLRSAPPALSLMPALTMEQLQKSHRVTPDGYYEFSLMELFFATGDREVQSLLDGMKIETEGRWMDEKVRNSNGTRKRLYRLFMTCCAADSRAIPIILEFHKTPPDYPQNDWVKISGTIRFPLEDGELHPVLTVDRVLAAEPPYEESFLRKK